MSFNLRRRGRPTPGASPVAAGPAARGKVLCNAPHPDDPDVQCERAEGHLAAVPGSMHMAARLEEDAARVLHWRAQA